MKEFSVFMEGLDTVRGEGMGGEAHGLFVDAAADQSSDGCGAAVKEGC